MFTEGTVHQKAVSDHPGSIMAFLQGNCAFYAADSSGPLYLLI